MAGTLGGRAKDISGRRFGRLLVISADPERRGGHIAWRCQCDCGAEVTIVGWSLRRGVSQSCGCLRQEKARVTPRTHGLKQSPEYSVWLAMRQRCGNPKHVSYKHYGERGIKVCPEWHDFGVFYRDMGPRPSPRHSIDRINVDGDYRPGNCRWATPSEQRRNQRAHNPAEAVS